MTYFLYVLRSFSTRLVFDNKFTKAAQEQNVEKIFSLCFAFIQNATVAFLINQTYSLACGVRSPALVQENGSCIWELKDVRLMEEKNREGNLIDTKWTELKGEIEHGEWGVKGSLP